MKENEKDTRTLYVVICDWVADSTGESGVSVIGASYDKDKAREIMKAQVEVEEATLPARLDQEESCEDQWEAYEDGYYNSNHVRFAIKETFVF